MRRLGILLAVSFVMIVLNPERGFTVDVFLGGLFPDEGETPYVLNAFMQPNVGSTEPKDLHTGVDIYVETGRRVQTPVALNEEWIFITFINGQHPAFRTVRRPGGDYAVMEIWHLQELNGTLTSGESYEGPRYLGKAGPDEKPHVSLFLTDKRPEEENTPPPKHLVNPLVYAFDRSEPCIVDEYTPRLLSQTEIVNCYGIGDLCKLYADVADCQGYGGCEEDYHYDLGVYSISVDVNGSEMDRIQFDRYVGRDGESEATLDDYYDAETYRLKLQFYWEPGMPDEIVWILTACDADRHATSTNCLEGDPSDPTVEPYIGSSLKRMILEPNPARTYLRILLPQGPGNGDIKLSVLDAAGRVVRRLTSMRDLNSEIQVMWDLMNEQGLPVSQGVYWIRASYPNPVLTRKVIVLR